MDHLSTLTGDELLNVHGEKTLSERLKLLDRYISEKTGRVAPKLLSDHGLLIAYIISSRFTNKTFHGEYAKSLPDQYNTPLTWNKKDLSLLGKCVLGHKLLQSVTAHMTILLYDYNILRNCDKDLFTLENIIWASASIRSRNFVANEKMIGESNDNKKSMKKLYFLIYFLRKFYPTSVLVTGFDIIFFWVARMMMLGMQFLNKEPFKEVYVHALVRDEKGQKMSKSKGNVIDPLVLIDSYSADALRFTLLSMASPGRDVKLSEQRVKGYRNFLTKIWNVNNFLQVNKCSFDGVIKHKNLKLNINKWIYSELIETKNLTENFIKNYRFDEAAKTVYKFVWNSYCDWYLELSKTILFSKKNKDIDEVKNTSGQIFKEILILLHPFIPFITEELWLKNKLKTKSTKYLMYANWIDKKKFKKDKNIENVNEIIDMISKIRSFKNELNVKPGSFVDISIEKLDNRKQTLFLQNQIVIKKLGRVNSIFKKDLSKKSVNLVISGEILKLYFDKSIDLDLIRQNLSKKQSKIQQDLDAVAKKLNNFSFVERAPKHIVEQEKNIYNDLKINIEKINFTLNSLK